MSTRPASYAPFLVDCDFSRTQSPVSFLSIITEKEWITCVLYVLCSRQLVLDFVWQIGGRFKERVDSMGPTLDECSTRGKAMDVNWTNGSNRMNCSHLLHLFRPRRVALDTNRRGGALAREYEAGFVPSVPR